MKGIWSRGDREMPHSRLTRAQKGTQSGVASIVAGHLTWEAPTQVWLSPLILLLPFFPSSFYRPSDSSGMSNAQMGPNRNPYILPPLTTLQRKQHLRQASRMEFGDQPPGDSYLDRAMFYKYVASDHSPSRYFRRFHRSYGLGSDIARVLEDTDPWLKSQTHDRQGYFGPIGELLGSYFGSPSGEPAASPYFGGDPLESFLGGKRRFLTSSALEILDLIRERQKIHGEHTQRLDQEACSIGSRLLELENRNMGISPAMERMRNPLEGQLQSLERERRSQEVGTWRDINGLRSDLRTIVGELGAETRKWSLLESEGPNYR